MDDDLEQIITECNEKDKEVCDKLKEIKTTSIGIKEAKRYYKSSKTNFKLGFYEEALNLLYQANEFIKYNEKDKEIRDKLKKIKKIEIKSTYIKKAKEDYKLSKTAFKSKKYEEARDLLYQADKSIKIHIESRKQITEEDIFPLKNLKLIIDETKEMCALLEDKNILKKKDYNYKRLGEYYKRLIEIEKEINEKNKKKYVREIYSLNDRIDNICQRYKIKFKKKII